MKGKELWPERNFHGGRQEQAGVKRFHAVKGCKAGGLEGSDPLSERGKHTWREVGALD